MYYLIPRRQHTKILNDLVIIVLTHKIVFKMYMMKYTGSSLCHRYLERYEEYFVIIIA